MVPQGIVELVVFCGDALAQMNVPHSLKGDALKFAGRP